ncbi:6-phospho-beta-glucosidase [Cohnella sp. WQ 127256]|uniref:6-phospho-beta-glucosidase n=1 Tax=Cohnella sp. WQ 127256 TaxID=2938790 RepID=UPI0021195A63|nr:6-phospho-beta-glucosidase [Cohnella sp. WQ 127256]
MAGLKIAVIGAGSSYTPELIGGFIKRKDELQVEKLYLMDINLSKLETVGNFAKKLLEKGGIKCEVVLTTDIVAAVRDVSFVLTQIRVGQLEARINDEKIPLKYDLIGQETVGIGGFMKAMRTIPVMKNISDVVKAYAKPGAWIVNFTNPAGLVTEALLNYTSTNAIGLCNCPFSMSKDSLSRVPEGTKDVFIEYVGLNHLAWITSIYADGVEILQKQLSGQYDFTRMKNIPIIDYDDVLIRSACGVPNNYLTYYYYPERHLQKEKLEEKTRGEVCRDIENELMDMYADPNRVDIPELLSQRGGGNYSEVALSVVSAIVNDKNERHIVNVRNEGALDFMADDDVIEINCLVGAHGAKAIAVPNFANEHIKSLMRTVKSYEKYAVKAGLYGDYEAAINALMMNPLVGDFTKAKGALDEMLEVNKIYLPQFFK